MILRYQKAKYLDLPGKMEQGGFDSSQRGQLIAAIDIDKHYTLFPNAQQYWLTGLKGSTFIQACDVINTNEELRDFQLKYSTGAGLLYSVGNP